jgi:hypothetical protein
MGFLLRGEEGSKAAVLTKADLGTEMSPGAGSASHLVDHGPVTRWRDGFALLPGRF